MIPFSCQRFHVPDGTPMISAGQLKEYANILLADYAPDLLRHPTPFPAEHFIEHYLGANLQYLDLYYPQGQPSLAGATVFAATVVPVFDRDKLCVRQVPVEGNTILIDNATLTRWGSGFCRFTHLHEAGHFLLHRHVFQPGILHCRHSTVCTRHRLRTQQDFLEYQANTLAAFLAMPAATFVPLVRRRMVRCGHHHGIWVKGTDYNRDFDPALQYLLEDLSDLYGVSLTAARIHMQRLGLLTDRYALSQTAPSG